MIAQRNLSLISNRLAEGGGRRIPEAVIERDYCLSWFLVGFSRSPLPGVLVFKGGTALKKCYFPDYRFSEDLDFTLTTEMPRDEIREALDVAFTHTRRASAVEIRFDREDRHGHENSYTFYLAYEGPLPRQRSNSVKVDITLHERLVYELEERPVLRGYDEYDDLPDDALIRAYSLNEIAAEKVVALLDRARNEPRDLYDLWFLIANGHVHLPDVLDAVVQKLAFRGITLDQVSDRLTDKEGRYKRLWKARLDAQMAELPEFDGVYRAVRRAFRQARISSRR